MLYRFVIIKYNRGQINIILIKLTELELTQTLETESNISKYVIHSILIKPYCKISNSDLLRKCLTSSLCNCFI